MFLYGLSSSLGCLFTFASFILNLFIVIGQLSIKPAIKNLYFAQASQQTTGRYYNLGLWNYCTGTASGLTLCSHPTPGYNWINTPGINEALPSVRLSDGLFLGAFILFILGMCFTFLLWIAGMPLCCVRARSVGASMSTLVGITFLVMLTALIMELVLIIRGNYLLHNADPTWSGHAGNSLWLTIGSVVSLLFAFFCYGGSCCCVGAKGGEAGGRRGRRGKKVTPFSDKHADMEAGGVGAAAGAGAAGETGGVTGGGKSPYNLNQSVYHTVQQQSPRVSQQQPYQDGHYSPVVSSQGFEHQPRNEMGSPHTPASPRQQGYQTPILQHSDVNTTQYN